MKFGSLTRDEDDSASDLYLIHAFIFVFDCSSKKTFNSLMCIIDTIHTLE